MPVLGSNSSVEEPLESMETFYCGDSCFFPNKEEQSDPTAFVFFWCLILTMRKVSRETNEGEAETEISNEL